MLNAEVKVEGRRMNARLKGQRESEAYFSIPFSIQHSAFRIATTHQDA
jgi:hypothetical protein